MKYIVTLNGKNYEVDVERGEAIVQSITDAVSLPAAVPEAPAAAPVAAPAAAGASVASGEKVLAPMPGNILNVKVSAGQAVKKGSVLVVLEAMKMENDIVALRDGLVAQVVVAKGQTVNTDDVLVVLA